MSHTTLQVQMDRGVCTLTLNRPEVRNAMSMTMVQELLTALSDAEADPQARVVVLRGAGRGRPGRRAGAVVARRRHGQASRLANLRATW